MSKPSLDLIRTLPKIELHAHLTASMKRNYFKQFLKKKNLDTDTSFLDGKDTDDVFRRVFVLLRHMVTHKADLKTLCQATFDSFIEDNVKYLEVRSTPKPLEDTDQLGYVDTIIETIKEYENRITVRYILSLNRIYPPENYTKVIENIPKKENWEKYVVGLDYCGDPWKRYITDYDREIRLGKDLGLGLTFHTAEFISQKPETWDLLNYGIDRVGHFYHFEENEIDFVKENGIMIETCPSSNFLTNELTSVKEHVLGRFIEDNMLFSICTDDLLLFDQELSEEIFLVSQNFDFGLDRIRDMSLNAVDKSFLREDVVKASLKREIEEAYKNVEKGN